jgi:hypothetical protein
MLRGAVGLFYTTNWPIKAAPRMGRMPVVFETVFSLYAPGSPLRLTT